MIQKEVVITSVDELKMIRGELDLHLDTINGNTNEIQSNFAFLLELNKKIEKLASRIDEFSLHILKQEKGPEIRIDRLTKREEHVFRTLYRLTEDFSSVSYEALAREASCSKNLISSYISNIIEKGVPVRKEYKKNKAFIFIDPAFRRQQTTKGIIGLNTQLTDFF